MRFMVNCTFAAMAAGPWVARENLLSPLSIFSRVIQFHENPSVSSIVGKEVGQQVSTQ